MDEETQPQSSGNTTSPMAVAAAWALVGIPLLWGLIATLSKAALLFS